MIIIAITLIILFRFSILRGVGYFLIREDSPVKVDAAFILSGDSPERSQKASELHKLGYFDQVYALGSQVNEVLEAVGIYMTDAELTQQILLDYGVDSSAIRLLPRGTSTYEESEEILGYAQTQGFDRIMVISSKFHTRRIKNIFNRKFQKAGIETFVIGSDPDDYDVDRWWDNEKSFIFVNNEYLKTVYYWLKY